MEKIFENLKKYNFWSSNKPNLGFIRNSYLSSIKKYINNNLVKVFFGQRRVGKSYIMRQIIHYLIENKNVNPKNIFYLNKEYIDFDQIDEYKQLNKLFLYYKKTLNVQGKIYIFIDEIQNIKRWELFVNSYSQDYTNQYEIFISGSNSNLLSKELASHLSGRYVEFMILPYSFEEFAQLKKQKKNKQTYLDYLKYGGLPELFHLNSIETKRNYVESVRNTIILRDIVARYSVKDIDLLESLFKYIMSNIGNLTTITNIVAYYKSIGKKTNYETVSSYLRFITDTMIVHELERYDIKGKQTLGGQRKYFINDLSFRNLIFGFRPYDIANILENAILLQIMQSGFQVNIGTLSNREIDFVAQKADKKIYVQVTYLLADQKVMDREFGNLQKIEDNYPKIVVSLDDIKFADIEGIKHFRAWEVDFNSFLH